MQPSSMLIIAVGVLALFTPAQAEEPAPPPVVILQRYFANMGIQTHLICRFNVSEGKANSVADARKKLFSKPPVILDGFWCFNGKKSHLLVNASQVILDRLDANHVNPLTFEQSMTNGQFYFRGGIDVPVGNFYRLGEEEMTGSVALPLNFFGGRQFDRYLSRSTEPGYAKSRWTGEGDAASGLLVELPSSVPKETCTIIFDPERGYLPIFHRNNTTPDQMRYERWITDAKQLPSGQWVPLTWVFIQYFPKTKATRLFTLEVTEYDPSVPTDDQFNVDLSRFAQVTERGHPFRIYHPHEGEILSVNHMERFAEKLVAVGKEREISESEHSDQFVASNGQSNRWRLVWLAIGLLVPLLTFGIIRWWRTRHARGATSNGDAGSTQGM